MQVNANGEPIIDPTLSQILTRLVWLERVKTALELENQQLRDQLTVLLGDEGHGK